MKVAPASDVKVAPASESSLWRGIWCKSCSAMQALKAKAEFEIDRALIKFGYEHWNLTVLRCAGKDGDNRRSMGPMYDMGTLKFRSHSYIREYMTVVNEDAAIDMAEHPWKSARNPEFESLE